MTLKADSVLNNTTVSQFYVLFNFLCGKSVLHKRAAEENVEKVDSFHIYILASTWKWTNDQSEPKKKLEKSFRKLIFLQALLPKRPGKALLRWQTPFVPMGSEFQLLDVCHPLLRPSCTVSGIAPDLNPAQTRIPKWTGKQTIMTTVLSQTWIQAQNQVQTLTWKWVHPQPECESEPIPKPESNPSQIQIQPNPNLNWNPNPNPNEMLRQTQARAQSQTQTWTQPNPKPSMPWPRGPWRVGIQAVLSPRQPCNRCRVLMGAADASGNHSSCTDATTAVSFGAGKGKQRL